MSNQTDNESLLARMADYKEHASWAVWDTKEDSLEFPLEDVEKGEPILRNDIVFLGLNPVGGKPGAWKNFHAKKGHYDASVKEALNNSAYKGAYMSDCISTIFEPKSSIVMKKFKDDKKSHLNKLHEELETLKKIHIPANQEKLAKLKSDYPFIVCFGVYAERIVKNLIKEQNRSRNDKETQLYYSWQVTRIHHYGGENRVLNKKIQTGKGTGQYRNREDGYSQIVSEDLSIPYKTWETEISKLLS